MPTLELKIRLHSTEQIFDQAIRSVRSFAHQNEWRSVEGSIGDDGGGDPVSRSLGLTRDLDAVDVKAATFWLEEFRARAPEASVQLIDDDGSGHDSAEEYIEAQAFIDVDDSAD